MIIEASIYGGTRIQVVEYLYYPGIDEWYYVGRFSAIEMPEHLRILKLLFGP